MFSHPKNVCMSYIDHLKHSMKFSYMFFIAAYKSFVHALIPDVYITSTTDTVDEIKNILENSGCNRSVQ